jgi:hypothetical protein
MEELPNTAQQLINASAAFSLEKDRWLESDRAHSADHRIVKNTHAGRGQSFAMSSNLRNSGNEFSSHNMGIEVQNDRLRENVSSDGVKGSFLVHQNEQLYATPPNFWAV